MTNFPRDPSYNEATILKILAEAKRPVTAHLIEEVLPNINHEIARASIFAILRSLIDSGLVKYNENTGVDRTRSRPAGSYEITEKGTIEILEVEAKIRRMLNLTMETKHNE